MFLPPPTFPSMFPVAAVTMYHKLNAWKQQKRHYLIIVHMLEIGPHRAKIKLLTDFHFLLEALGEKRFSYLFTGLKSSYWLIFISHWRLWGRKSFLSFSALLEAAEFLPSSKPATVFITTIWHWLFYLNYRLPCKVTNSSVSGIRTRTSPGTTILPIISDDSNVQLRNTCLLVRRTQAVAQLASWAMKADWRHTLKSWCVGVA